MLLTATNLAMSLIIVFHSNKKFQLQKSASQANCIGLTATEPSSSPDPCNAKNVDKCFCFFLLFCLFNFSFMCTGLYFRPVYLIHVKSKLITCLSSVAVSPKLPVRGNFLMGNDIAGGNSSTNT